MTRLQEYIYSFKLILMIWYTVKVVLITLAIAGPIIYLFGANNPPKSILQKLLNKHKDSIDKIMKS